ncbi:heme-binding protein [Cryptosporangium sp. NPDC048952]|uniref:GlcG/HbpS family heme-binding protein n=1 Tax=Cryptosporangium sp. NPDC048952 TaxID=3363961 RepID=UPI003722F6F2
MHRCTAATVPASPQQLALAAGVRAARAAQAVVAAAQERARELGARVTVAVVDEGGHLVALGRMDGAPPLSAQIAEAKAASVALFRRDGAALLQMQEAWPAFFARVAASRPVLAGAGSLLIRRADEVWGAVAASGGTPEHDDECAGAGVAAI